MGGVFISLTHLIYNYCDNLFSFPGNDTPRIQNPKIKTKNKTKIHIHNTKNFIPFFLNYNFLDYIFFNHYTTSYIPSILNIHMAQAVHKTRIETSHRPYIHLISNPHTQCIFFTAFVLSLSVQKKKQETLWEQTYFHRDPFLRKFISVNSLLESSQYVRTNL